MKTTKRTAVEKRIEKLISDKQITKQSLVYRWLTDMLKGEKTFRPVFSQGSSWKHSSLIDKSVELKTTLSKLKLSFVDGNDSPRGGKTGYFVTVTTKIK